MCASLIPNPLTNVSLCPFPFVLFRNLIWKRDGESDWQRRWLMSVQLVHLFFWIFIRPLAIILFFTLNMLANVDITLLVVCSEFSSIYRQHCYCQNCNLMNSFHSFSFFWKWTKKKPKETSKIEIICLCGQCFSWKSKWNRRICVSCYTRSCTVKAIIPGGFMVVNTHIFENSCWHCWLGDGDSTS